MKMVNIQTKHYTGNVPKRTAVILRLMCMLWSSLCSVLYIKLLFCIAVHRTALNRATQIMLGYWCESSFWDRAQSRWDKYYNFLNQYGCGIFPISGYDRFKCLSFDNDKATPSNPLWSSYVLVLSLYKSEVFTSFSLHL